jgi:antitoxin PrlF
MAMTYSTVTRKGQTTIPREVRQALKIKAGDRLQYSVKDGEVTVRVHPGIRSIRGALAGNEGRGLSFAQIREAAAKAARARGYRK